MKTIRVIGIQYVTFDMNIEIEDGLSNEDILDTLERIL